MKKKAALRKNKLGIWIILYVFLFPLNGLAEPKFTNLDECLKAYLKTADDRTPVGELKKYCDAYLKTAPDEEINDGNVQDCLGLKKKEESIIDTRLEEEKQNSYEDFTLTPHRANYLIPFAYNESPNYGVYGGALKKDDLDKMEVKFQFSIKYMLFDNVLKKTGDIYFAYTNLSYWQAYNTDLSSPFRDTSHEPELWIQFDTEKIKSLGLKSRLIQFGAVHQSNGRSEPLSRSWNRIFANFVFERGNLIFGLKPWWRIPEKKEEDNNPNIHKYLGYGELALAYKWRNQTLTMMFRNNLRDSSENRGAIQVAWSFPLHKKLKGYLQYFSGYGQTILDYDDSANTFGFGIALSDII